VEEFSIRTVHRQRLMKVHRKKFHRTWSSPHFPTDAVSIDHYCNGIVDTDFSGTERVETKLPQTPANKIRRHKKKTTYILRRFDLMKEARGDDGYDATVENDTSDDELDSESECYDNFVGDAELPGLKVALIPKYRRKKRLNVVRHRKPPSRIDLVKEALGDDARGESDTSDNALDADVEKDYYLYYTSSIGDTEGLKAALLSKHDLGIPDHRQDSDGFKRRFRE
ncbi:Unknown protein, partial [Striga hermonthica]